MGVWAERGDRILAAVEQLPELPWPLRVIVDQDGGDTGFAVVRGLVDDDDRDAFEDVSSTHRLIGAMQWWGFPQPEFSWGAQDYQSTPADPATDGRWDRPEVAACEAWAYATRDPRPWLPPGKPRFMLGESDFIDVDATIGAAVGAWPDRALAKRWDVVCSDVTTRFGEVQANWSLGRRCVERLAGDLGLSVLLLSRAGTPDVPDLPNVEVRPALGWDESVGCVARSRLLLVPHRMDPSARLMAEALAVGVPVLAYSELLCGWHYVHPETGQFFEDEDDVAVGALRCLATEYDTCAWLRRSHGRDRAARHLAGYMQVIGAPEGLRYALPTSLFR